MNNSTIIQKLTSRVWRDRLSGYKQLEEIKTPNGWINLLKEIPDNNPILIDSLVSHLIKFFSESERSDSSTLALFTFSSSSPFWPNLNAYKNLMTQFLKLKNIFNSDKAEIFEKVIYSADKIEECNSVFVLIRALSLIASPSSSKALVPFLKSSNEKIIIESLVALKFVAKRENASDILNLIEHSNSTIAKLAIEVSAKISPSRRFHKFLFDLYPSANTRLKSTIINIIIVPFSKNSLKILNGILKSEDDENVKFSIVKKSQFLREKDRLVFLVEYFNTEYPFSVDMALRSCLLSLNEKSKLQFIRKALFSSNPRMQRAAVLILKSFPKKEAKKLFIKSLKRFKKFNPIVKSAFIEHCAAHTDSKTIYNFLIKQLSSGELIIETTSAMSLIKGNAEPSEILGICQSKPNAWILIAALGTCHTLSNKQLPEPLRQKLVDLISNYPKDQEGSLEVRSLAASILLKFRSKESFLFLWNSIEAFEPNIQLETLSAIAKSIEKNDSSFEWLPKTRNIKHEFFIKEVIRLVDFFRLHQPQIKSFFNLIAEHSQSGLPIYFEDFLNSHKGFWETVLFETYINEENISKKLDLCLARLLTKLSVEIPDELFWKVFAHLQLSSGISFEQALILAKCQNPSFHHFFMEKFSDTSNILFENEFLPFILNAWIKNNFKLEEIPHG